MSDLASLMYSSMAAPAAAPAPAPQQPATPSPAPATTPVQAPAVESTRPDDAVLVSMYGETPPTTHAPVNWSEGAARPGEYELTGPADVIGDTHDADHEMVRGAFSAAGIGPTAGAELYRHVAEVAAAGTTFEPAGTMAQLRQTWGGYTEQRLAACQAAVAKLPQAARDALDRTGAGNDPALIRKVWAGLSAAQKRGK